MYSHKSRRLLIYFLINTTVSRYGAFAKSRQQKRPATDSSFDERMCIICQTYVRGEKLSRLGEEGCDKLLQAAFDRWDRPDYANIDVIGRPETAYARKEG